MRAAVESLNPFDKLPESLVAALLSFLSGPELLLAAEHTCQRFRRLSLSGRPWSDATTPFWQLSKYLDFEALLFFRSGRLRFLTTLAAPSPYADLAWLQPRPLPRLRVLALASPRYHMFPVLMGDRALRPLLALRSLEVSKCHAMRTCPQCCFALRLRRSWIWSA
jgi:hypothetical protein